MAICVREAGCNNGHRGGGHLHIHSARKLAHCKKYALYPHADRLHEEGKTGKDFASGNSLFDLFRSKTCTLEQLSL